MNVGREVLPRTLPITVTEPTRMFASSGNKGVIPLGEVGLDTNLSFRNGLPWPVTIVQRNGLATTIPPLTGNWQSCRDFEIMVRYRFARNVKIDVHRLLDVINDESSQEMRTLRSAISIAETTTSLTGNECLITYALNRELFESKPSIYLDSLDVTLSIENPAYTQVCHPESIYGRILQLTQQPENKGMRFKIEINDPDQHFGTRFLNICGKVYRINPLSDKTRASGVYVYTTGCLDDSGNQEKFVPFESADAELMLFRTADDANVLGNLEGARKREIEELQHRQKMDALQREQEHKERVAAIERKLADYKQEVTERENGFHKDKLEWQNQNLQLERLLKEREHELSKAKQAREEHMAKQKDYYEQRSLARKDSSEIIKWIPPILVTIGVLFSKFRSA